MGGGTQEATGKREKKQEQLSWQQPAQSIWEEGLYLQQQQG